MKSVSPIELHSVTKRFQSQVALENLSLSVRAGSTTVLLGQSGCGKSTLLRLLVGLVRPDAGRVVVDGIELAPQVPRRNDLLKVRKAVGYVIQEGGLFPHLTARENLSLLARVEGWQPDRIESRISELSSLTHFPEDALSRYPGELSGGQRQRVSLMRALMLDPAVLLFDEPLGSLDPMIRNELQGELKTIFTSLKKTVVLVTHDLAEAAFLADTIVMMKDGRVLQEGTLSELVHKPSDPFVSKFISAQRSPLDTVLR